MIAGCVVGLKLRKEICPDTGKRGLEFSAGFRYCSSGTRSICSENQLLGEIRREKGTGMSSVSEGRTFRYSSNDRLALTRILST